jgi:hypothetical protein
MSLLRATTLEMKGGLGFAFVASVGGGKHAGKLPDLQFKAVRVILEASRPRYLRNTGSASTAC